MIPAGNRETTSLIEPRQPGAKHGVDLLSR